MTKAEHKVKTDHNGTATGRPPVSGGRTVWAALPRQNQSTLMVRFRPCAQEQTEPTAIVLARFAFLMLKLFFSRHCSRPTTYWKASLTMTMNC